MTPLLKSAGRLALLLAVWLIGHACGCGQSPAAILPEDATPHPSTETFLSRGKLQAGDTGAASEPLTLPDGSQVTLPKLE